MKRFLVLFFSMMQFVGYGYTQTKNVEKLDEIDYFKLHDIDPNRVVTIQNVKTDWGKIGLKGYVKTMRQSVQYEGNRESEVKSFHFNILGQLTKYEEFEDATTPAKVLIEYIYNKKNQLVKIITTKAGKSSVKNVQYSVNNLVAATYHKNGLVASYGRDNCTFTYNSDGQIIKLKDNALKANTPFLYSYNLSGRCVKETYNEDLTVTKVSKNSKSKLKMIKYNIHKFFYNEHNDSRKLDPEDTNMGENMRMIETFLPLHLKYIYDSTGNWISRKPESSHYEIYGDYSLYKPTIRQFIYYSDKELAGEIGDDSKIPQSDPVVKDSIRIKDITRVKDSINVITTEVIVTKDIYSAVSDKPIIWDCSIANSFHSGEGTQKSPFIIATPSQLAFLAKIVNEGNSCDGKFFYLINDMDLGSKNQIKCFWEPIGVKKSSPFGGIFWSSNKTVYNMEIDKGQDLNIGVGLFGVLSDSAKISGINIDNSCVIKGVAAGGIAGINNGKVKGCKSFVKAEGNDIGGIVGLNNGSISDCSSSADLQPLYVAGGICAKNGGAVERCSFKGNILFFITTKFCGGIVGELITGGRIIDCYNRGSLSANTFILMTGTGGIVGSKNIVDKADVIKNCYNAGIGTGFHIMPNYKKNIGNIINCYFDVEIKTLNKSEKKEEGWYKTNGAKTTEEMKTTATVILLNAERFDGPWMEDKENDNGGYPIIKKSDQ